MFKIFQRIIGQQKIQFLQLSMEVRVHLRMHALRIVVLRTCRVSTLALVIFQVLSQMHCHHAWLLCHLITGGQIHRLLQLLMAALHRL